MMTEAVEQKEFDDDRQTATEEEIVADVTSILDELLFSRLLIRSLLFFVLLFGIGSVIKMVVTLGARYLPLLAGLIF